MDTTVTHVTMNGQQRAVARDPGDIPNYELLTFINAGGFGDVWLARERVTGVRRAVKVLHKADVSRAARDIDGVRRYQRCTHNHPHLLQILTVGETERCFYYVMEAADNAARDPAPAPVASDLRVRRGTVAQDPTPDTEVRRYSADAPAYVPTTLRTVMQTRGRFAARDALELLQKLTSAVSGLHEQGLAHYDLKPENVLIVDAEPKIADVGLVAPKDQPPQHTGTRSYMTPQEQADDLYALGKILYELISGRAATDFPRLPPELLQDLRPDLAAAVRIANRACHTDAARRFGSVADLQASVAAALRFDRSLRARWRRLSRRGRLLASACAATVVLAAFVAGDAIHARVVPRVRFEQQVPLSADRWLLVSDVTPLQGERRYPYLRLNGTPLEKPGVYAYELAHPVENFLLEARVLSSRPWGVCCIALAGAPDGSGGVRAELYGQPDGRGLQVELESEGLPRDGTSEIWGHPQPGVKYVLRLARVGDRVALALWPLSRDSRAPLQVDRDLPQTLGPARYVVLESSTADSLSELDVRDLRVVDYSIPLQHIDRALPGDVARGLQPTWPPELPPAAELPAGNLLANGFHPYDSAAWMSIGNWSWWEGAAPGAIPKRIRCTPCSTQMRAQLHAQPGDAFGGFQFLRLDRARYGDFEATLHVSLATPPGAPRASDDPFVCASEDGTVGLAFRLQDTPPPGSAWGGGYVAAITLYHNEQTTGRATLTRSSGFSLIATHETAVGSGSGQILPDGGAVVPIDRAELLAPEGFALGLRAVGSHFTMAVNGQQVLETDDPGGYSAGRIALFASRLIATFESLEVTPLD